MSKKLFPIILTSALTLFSSCTTLNNCDTAIFSEFSLPDNYYQKYQSTIKQIPFSDNIYIGDINKDGKTDFMLKYEREF